VELKTLKDFVHAVGSKKQAIIIIIIIILTVMLIITNLKYVAIPGDRNLINKEAEKIIKFLLQKFSSCGI
jgi:flagellar basal body-associated protein FliL